MKPTAVTIIAGICIGVLAAACQIKSFTFDWWAFLIAGNVMVFAIREERK